MATVYRKTDKGRAEIETRAHRLLPRLRSALILVDGKKTDEELMRLVLAEPAATLASLLADGFIEVLATLAEPQPERPPERQAERKPAAARSGSDGAAFAARSRDAVHEINHQIGPLAEALALKMERAKTAAELQPLLVQASEMLRRMRGGASADAFVARFLSAPDA